jgi:hypothetical protein
MMIKVIVLMGVKEKLKGQYLSKLPQKKWLSPG